MTEIVDNKKQSGISLKTIGAIVSVLAFIVSSLLVATSYFLSSTFNSVQTSINDYMVWKDTAQDMQAGSDELTTQVRSFVATGKSTYIEGYFYEVSTKRRENALETIKQNLENTLVYEHLENALKESINLMDREYYAMRLTIDYSSYVSLEDECVPDEVRNVELSAVDSAKSNDEKKELAIDYVFGDKYAQSKNIIISSVQEAVSTLDGMKTKSVIDSSDQLKGTMILQQILVIFNIIFIVGTVMIFYFKVIKPINKAVNNLVQSEDVNVKGIREYRYLAKTYNMIRQRNANYNEKLIYQAEHDKLTGLFNRAGYDTIYQNMSLDQCLFILIDVDYFKEVNDEYGHASGDKVLKRISEVLTNYFKAEDEYIFRIGGDEFAIIKKDGGNKVEDAMKRCNEVNKELMKGNKESRITLSIGVAIGNAFDTTDTLFKKADIALYHTKENGRGAVTLFDESLRANNKKA